MAVPVTQEDPFVDTIVGDRYRVVRKLGEGGMCAIYEALHINLQRSFALKALLPALCSNRQAVDRFVREAELLGSLRHRNVVAISDWITLPDGAPCMVLEFLHGATLQTRLMRAPMSWEAIARIGDQTMSALALSHRLGITHRDLKPENIFISIDDSGDEQAKLLDFGISKLRGVGRLSAVNQVLGTPSYMSPEQLIGDTALIGPATDAWAMGTILYEMATQQIAFKGEDIVQTLELIRTARPPPITDYRGDVPAEFIDLVERAISHDPAVRIQTIEELREGLRVALPRHRTAQLAPPRLTPLTSRARVATPPAVPIVEIRSPTLSPKSTKPKSPTQPPPTVAPTPTAAGSSRRMWVILAVAAVLITAGNVVLAFVL